MIEWLLATVVVVGVVLLLRKGFRWREVDWGHGWLNWLDGVNRWFCRRYHRLEAEPIQLPASGAAVLVCNHLSGLDPLAMIAASKRPLRFVIAREQYERWWLKWLFQPMGMIPVDRGFRPDKAFYDARQALSAGEVVALFPQGGIQTEEDSGGGLKRGAVMLARHAGVPIYMCRIDGIAGRGMTVLAVALRSRVRIESLAEPVISESPADDEACLDVIERYFSFRD